ncbi:MAG: flagellar biosynthetic protein FliQ [Pseudomonadota bacterium]
MTEADIFEVLRSALWTAVLMGAPILTASLVIGFLIGLIQALTSIQELTLTFIPKVGVVVAVFFLTIGYMTRLCLDLFYNSVLPLVGA